MLRLIARRINIGDKLVTRLRNLWTVGINNAGTQKP